MLKGSKKLNYLSMANDQLLTSQHGDSNCFGKITYPLLRYHNPDIQFTVNNITVESESELSKLPLKLKVHGTDQSNSFEINCTDKPPSKILSELIEITKARKLTEEELPKLPLRPVK